MALAQSKSPTNDTVTGHSNAQVTGLTMLSHRAAGGLWAEHTCTSAFVPVSLHLPRQVSAAGDGPVETPIPQKPSERGGRRARFIEGAPPGRGEVLSLQGGRGPAEPLPKHLRGALGLSMLSIGCLSLRGRTGLRSCEPVTARNPRFLWFLVHFGQMAQPVPDTVPGPGAQRGTER